MCAALPFARRAKPFQKPLPAPRGAPAQLQAARAQARRIRQYAGSCAGGPRDATLMLEPLELLRLPRCLLSLKLCPLWVTLLRCRSRLLGSMMQIGICPRRKMRTSQRVLGFKVVSMILTLT